MLRLLDADILCTRIFDVADTIVLDRCRQLISKGGAESRRLTLVREGSEFIQLSDPPVLVELPARKLVVAGAEREVKLDASVYTHGAISITVRVPVTRGVTVDELIPVADELYDSKALDALALEEVDRLRKLLEPAFEVPHLWEQSEGYTIIFARELEGRPTAEQVLASKGLARLLLGETKEVLSAGEEHEVLDHHYSYTPNDLAIIEWNAAFIYEPTGSEDIVELLELANAQLLELRYFDAVLDQELQRIYDVVGEKRPNSLFRSPWRRALRSQMQTLIELSEFIERVENTLKIVGDVYLARVYEAGLTQLRITNWTEQVTRKHRLLVQTYNLLKGETDTGRALTLETLVVILILVEIVMGLVKASH
ncbi:MAG: hypothetical protein ACOZQL_13515 [Myxococcota bacterium]